MLSLAIVHDDALLDGEPSVDEDEDLMKQVYIDGLWHRELHGTIHETACGLLFHTEFTNPRRFSLIGPLCRNCHAIRELAKSEDLAAIAREELEK
jgi:hypothetical protein